MLDLESAIEHYEEAAKMEKKKADEHRQLADWLNELKNARETLKAMYSREGVI